MNDQGEVMGDRMQRRYPGTRPFLDSELDRSLFKGREDDLQRFLHLVLAERLVVLFSKSGAGKTSLLNAGLSPLVRERGYFPVTVRLNNPKKPPIHLIDQQARQAAASANIECIAGNDSSLLEYFRTCEFWGPGDTLLTPVLMFDQFEELFSLDYSQEQQDDFFRQLAELVHGQATRNVAERKTSETRRSPQGPPDVKVILSLREDFLANLEEIHADIPSIFHNRFRLRSLTPTQARRAITEPASWEHLQLATRPFSFDNQTVDAMIGFLQKGGTDTESRPAAIKRFVPWVLLGAGVALFSYLFDPVVGTLGDSIVFMKQPAVLSVSIAFASLILAYYFPLKPVYAVTAVFLFQFINLGRYWIAVGGTDFSVEAKIIIAAVVGAVASGWVAWLRWRQFPSPSRESKTVRPTEIETPQIQLLCQQVEEIVARKQAKGGNVTVALNDLGGEEGMQEILADFYRAQMRRLSPMKWWVAHTLCEQGLISMSGKRLSLDGEFIADKYKASRALLDELIEKHLLRAESRLGSQYYELTHDSLVKPIQDAARERLRHTRVFLLLAVCATVLFFVGKDLMEKASAAKELVEARKTLRTASFMLDEIRLGGSGHDSMFVLLGRVDSILKRQDSVLGLAAMEQRAPRPVRDIPSPAPEPEQTRAVTGRIVDRRNQGVPRARIVLNGREYSSDSNGEFKIDDLPEQTYSMKILREGFRDTILLEIQPGQGALYIRLQEASVRQLQPATATGSLAGRVVDSDNDPVGGAVITLEGASRGRVSSANDGRFIFNNLTSGSYRVKISGSGYDELVREGVNVSVSRTDAGDFKLLQSAARPILQNPNEVVAEYPREALALRVSGTVRIRATVDSQGKVTDVHVLEGVHPLLDSTAVRAARKGVFQGSGYWKTKYSFRHPGSQ